MQSVIIVQSSFNVLRLLAVSFFLIYFKDAKYNSFDQRTHLCKKYYNMHFLKLLTNVIYRLHMSSSRDFLIYLFTKLFIEAVLKSRIEEMLVI